MGSFLGFTVVVFLTVVGGWFLVSRYFRKADATRVKERLTGTAKAVKKAKTEAEPQSVLHTQRTSKNKLAVLVVERYQLGPKVQLLLEQAGLSQWTPARLVHMCIVAFGATLAFCWILLPIPSWMAFLAALAVAPTPFGYVWWLRRDRLKKFEAIFPETLEFISRSMRAGHAFSVSLEMIHREFAEPVSGEFRRAFEEHNLGLPIETALQKLAKRVPSLDVHFFVSAVLLQKRTGGNLAEILDKLAYVIRERFKLRGRIRAVSAHGRMTATSLSCIPIGVAVLMFYANPDYVTFFFTDEAGNIMMGVGVFLQVAGYLVMRKIVNIEV